MILFPCALLFAPIPTFFIHPWIESALTLFHEGVLFCDRIHNTIPALSPHFGHLVLLLGWILLRGRQRRFLALLLIILSAPLETFKKSSPSSSRWEVVPTSHATIVATRGQTQHWSDGVSCRMKWRGDRWEENCRPTKRVRRQKIITKKLSYLR
jgi:hypothetical protein